MLLLVGCLALNKQLFKVGCLLFVLLSINIINHFYSTLWLYCAAPVCIALLAQIRYRYVNLIVYITFCYFESFNSYHNINSIIGLYGILSAANLYDLLSRMKFQYRFQRSDILFSIITLSSIVESISLYLLKIYLIINIQNMIFYSLLAWVMWKFDQLNNIFPVELNSNIQSISKVIDHEVE